MNELIKLLWQRRFSSCEYVASVVLVVTGYWERYSLRQGAFAFSTTPVFFVNFNFGCVDILFNPLLIHTLTLCISGSVHWGGGKVISRGMRGKAVPIVIASTQEFSVYDIAVSFNRFRPKMHQIAGICIGLYNRKVCLGVIPPRPPQREGRPHAARPCAGEERGDSVPPPECWH